MRTLTVIPERGQRRKRPSPLGPSPITRPTPTTKTTINTMKRPSAPATIALKHHPRPHPHRTSNGRVMQHIRRAFTPLIDAKAASGLLGVPYTWLLAQARAGKIPHHRLGHYVRFNPDDLDGWLKDTKIEPRPGYPGRLR
jgi:excisionase family DNA binding protein